MNYEPQLAYVVITKRASCCRIRETEDKEYFVVPCHKNY